MAWQTPKTNWAAADGVRNSDMNRIEGNTLELRNQAILSTVYQSTAASRNTISTQSFTTNPIPTTWTAVTGYTEYMNGGYRVKASDGTSNQPAYLAFDGNAATPNYMYGTEAWTQIELPEALLVEAIKIRVDAPSYATSIKIQGSNDGASWATVHTLPSASITSLTEIQLSDPGTYKFYRLHVTSSSAGATYLYEFQLSRYSVTTYEVKHTLTFGSTLVNGQRMLIATPATYSLVGAVSNTLNNLPIDALLKPGSRYQLIYTGTGFIATEVA